MPSTRRHFRRLETPNGAGTLHDGERFVATVTYALTVLQEIVGTHHWTGSRARRGERQVSGQLQITSGAVPFEDDRLTLRLDDGRTLLFVAAGAGPGYVIEAGGALRGAV